MGYMNMDYCAVFSMFSEDFDSSEELFSNDKTDINCNCNINTNTNTNNNNINGYTSFALGLSDPLEIMNDSWGLSADALLTGTVSVTREEVASDPNMRIPSRKSSLDITAFPPLESDSPISNVDSSSVDEVPCLSLPPSQIKREKSFSDLLQEEAYRLRAVECKKRRLLRMEILRKKRQQGLIDYGHTIRYKQRSDLATRRVRSSGKFVSEYNYKNV